jgi:hypothetical protein
MKKLKNFFKGIGSILNIFPSNDYVKPSKDGFAQDAKALQKDWETIGKDFPI